MRTVLIITGAIAWGLTSVAIALAIYLNICDRIERRRIRRELSDDHLARTLDTWAHQ